MRKSCVRFGYQSNLPRVWCGVGWRGLTGPLLRFAVAGTLVAALAGCSSFVDMSDNMLAGVTGAAPLSDAVNGLDNKPIDQSTSGYIQAQIRNSIRSCDAYKRRLLLASRTSNAGFDVLTTIFSALGSVFTPLGTVHALTAAATISSGTKTAIDADIYQNATAPLMVEAIQQTYDKDMATLLQQQAGGGAPADPQFVYTEIIKVHSECSLTEAMAQLQLLESKQAQQSPAGATAEPGVKLSATVQTLTQTGGSAQAVVAVSSITDDSVVLKVSGLKLAQAVTSVTDNTGHPLAYTANGVTLLKASGDTTLKFTINGLAKADTFSVVGSGVTAGMTTGTSPPIVFTVGS